VKRKRFGGLPQTGILPASVLAGRKLGFCKGQLGNAAAVY